MHVREISTVQPAQVLLSTTERGWAETDLARIQAGGVPSFDSTLDRRGPIPVVVASELGGSRLAVVGSDEFALNAWLREDIAYDHGRDLILILFGWLTQREALLGLRPRPREHVKLVLQDEPLRRMTLMCVLGLPGFAVLLGLTVLWRRRR